MSEPIGKLVAIDARDLALLVTITRDGMCEASAPHCSKEQAAAWMRHLADQWDPQRHE